MRDHFKRVTELRYPYARSAEERSSRAARFLVAPPEESLILTLPGSVPAPVDEVAVSYGLDSYLYTFEAGVVEARPDRERPVTLLLMNLPDRVARIERRKSARVTCSHREPVTIRLFLADGEPYQGTTVDIGLRGAGFHMPTRPVPIRWATRFPVLVTFPRLGELRVNAVARALTHTPDSSRVGVEFLDLSEEHADLIRQYVHLRQLRIRFARESAVKTPPLAKSIFVVAIEDPPGSRQLILCTDAFLRHMPHGDAVLEIASVDVIEYLEKE